MATRARSGPRRRSGAGGGLEAGIRYRDKSLGVESGRQTERREDLGILEHRIPADALGGDSEDLESVQLVSATDAPIGSEPGLAVGRDRLQTPVCPGLPEDPLHKQAVVPAAGEPVE